MPASNLRPQKQGVIDGLCAVYAVLNACKLLFEHSEQTDKNLLHAMCDDTADLFPAIVYGGTEVEGVLRLIGSAQAWVKKKHRRELLMTRPARHKPATIEAHFAGLRTELAKNIRTVAVVGLGKPWEHWTVLRHVGREHAIFFDSWGFPHRVGFENFTLDKASADGENLPVHLPYRQTFFLST